MTTHGGPLPSLSLRFAVEGGALVSALLDAPAAPVATYVFAHGAGAGMQHPFMAAIAHGLASRGIATLRFQFPFMERGSGRPDTPGVAQAAVRAAVAEAARRLPGVPLFAGGKSFGGRMASQAQAAAPMPSLQGLVFVGFPLHPAGKPSTKRAAHLAQVDVPMLFLQGTRDALADLPLMQAQAGALGPLATMHVVDGADHAFHVLVRSGRTDEQVQRELLEAMVRWMLSVSRPAPEAT
jgi:predicted alpha/beta-hydrolase family hydrolase